MSSTGTVRSCIRCHEAKRKCDRVTPSCRLCRRKKLECIYPSRRPSNFVPIETAYDASSPPPEFNMLDFEAMSNELTITSTPPEPAQDPAIPSLAITLDARGSWFLAPETFTVDHTPMPLPPNFKLSDLKDFVRLIERWLATWITTGSNTFIHAHLYEGTFPSCLQIAFATFSAYLNRTPTTTAMILRAVNDQATALISASNEGGTSCKLLIDLARIHALLAYQIIGLFDGDIRSRHLAEKRAPHLSKALDRALENASATLTRHLSANDVTVSLANPTSPTELLWQSWIVSESLRRTWLVAQGISASYDGLKLGWAPCKGDVMFTTREGLWAASEASLWTRMCADGDVHFGGRFLTECLFDGAPEGVDEFGKAMMEAVFGRERFVEWLCSTHC
ncbi:hypothetical protein K458DRAFT_424599 [Lentithecium fluviatile CBS 122367]|uniref:Zn(2)-C6 fungal-type domain-containing protein n=1 Tax=Lentithecium fluviatile CBS 122367 TaxID=1168545 RepID=A0A6G1IEV6_9PLEO|nr:hypothetical protein K458DRAFT_424599 [Lentithecium fluviatile CBS 122367]